MSKPRVTPWFPGDVKPVRNGAYFVGGVCPDGSIVDDLPYPYYLFRGGRWHCAPGRTPDGALEWPTNALPMSGNFVWRGLAKAPQS